MLARSLSCWCLQFIFGPNKDYVFPGFIETVNLYFLDQDGYLGFQAILTCGFCTSKTFIWFCFQCWSDGIYCATMDIMSFWIFKDYRKSMLSCNTLMRGHTVLSKHAEWSIFLPFFLLLGLFFCLVSCSFFYCTNQSRHILQQASDRANHQSIRKYEPKSKKPVACLASSVQLAPLRETNLSWIA